MRKYTFLIVILFIIFSSICINIVIACITPIPPENCDAVDYYRTGDGCQCLYKVCINGVVSPSFTTVQCACDANWNGDSCEICALTGCGPGQILQSGPNTCQCITGTCPECANGGIVVNNSGICSCDCNSAFPWSGEHCDVCEITCNLGEKIDSGDCICQSCSGLCSIGQFYENPGTCDCTSCNIVCANGGSIISDGKTEASCDCSCVGNWGGSMCQLCTLVSSECPAGTTFNSATCQCDSCSPTTCSDGYYRDQGSCTCNLCPNECVTSNAGVLLISNGNHLNTCDCACTDPKWDGPSCDECVLQCGPGQQLNEAMCICETAPCPTECDSGFYLSACSCINCLTTCNTSHGGTIVSDGQSISSCECECSPTQPQWTGISCNVCNPTALLCDQLTQIKDTTSGKCECKTCPTCSNGGRITTNDNVCGCDCSEADPWGGSTCSTCTLTEEDCSIDQQLNLTTCTCDPCSDCNSCSLICENNSEPNDECTYCNCIGGWADTTCTTCAATQDNCSATQLFNENFCECHECSTLMFEVAVNSCIATGGTIQYSTVLDECFCQCPGGKILNSENQQCEFHCPNENYIWDETLQQCQCNLLCPISVVNTIQKKPNNECTECVVDETCETGSGCGEVPKLLPTFLFSDSTTVLKGASISIEWIITGNIQVKSTDIISIYIIGAGFSVLNNDDDDNDSYFETLQQQQQHQYQQYSSDEIFTLLATDPYSYFIGNTSAIQEHAYTIHIPMNIQPSENAQIHLILSLPSLTTKVEAKSQRFIISSNSICTDCNNETQQCELIQTFPEVKSKCVCKRGFIETSSNVCQLPCHNSCAPNGKCTLMKDKVGVVIGSKCLCEKGYSGINCQISSNKCPEQDLKQCNGHGTTYNNDQDKCTNICQCDTDVWYGTKCDTCYLYHDNNATIQCDENGTDIELTKTICSTIENQQCKCKPGFYGNRCQYRAIYGTLHFRRSSSLIKQSIHVDITPETTSSSTTTITKSISMLFLNQTNLEYLTPEAKYILERDLSLSLGINADSVILIGLFETELSDTTDDNKYQISTIFLINSNIEASIATSSSIIHTQHTQFNIQQATLDNLYSSWSNLSTNFDTTPIKATEASREVGIPQSAAPAYDPECKSTSTTTCPTGTTPFSLQTDEEQQPKKKASAGVIIGIVIGIIAFVVLLFVIVICSLNYCKKNETCCFAKENNTRNGTSKTSNNIETEMTVATQKSETNNDDTTTKSTITSTTTKSVDLVEIKDHGEKLPSGWSKQQHNTTGEIFYVNNDKMISQRHSPVDGVGGDNASSQW